MYAKARAGELNRCRDVRRATCGTIVRERLKREGSPPLRRRGANLRFTRGDANSSQQQALQSIAVIRRACSTRAAGAQIRSVILRREDR